ncbi:unnamed protein product [Discosporangium mesarthrocarpum]
MQAKEELDGIEGGWQWLCQGTPAGDALIRYAPGERHIAGWTVSEEERLTTSQALREAAQLATQWNPFKLRQFMGAAATDGGHSVEVGNLTPRNYFTVISNMGLLPREGEDSTEWFERVRR